MIVSQYRKKIVDQMNGHMRGEKGVVVAVASMVKVVGYSTLTVPIPGEERK